MKEKTKKKREPRKEKKNAKRPLPLSEEEDKFQFPKIPITPMTQCKNQILYAFSNALLIFDLISQTFIKHLEDHTGTIRSVDVSEIDSLVLTCGDDKQIIVYNTQWKKLHTIVHKKKITFAYFFNRTIPNEEVKIIFADKYGDVYLVNLSLLMKQENSTSVESKEKDHGMTNKQVTKPNLTYMYDNLNYVTEENGSTKFIKDFDEIIQDLLDNTTYANSRKRNVMDTKKENHSSTECKKDDSTVINNVKQQLEKHYKTCFTTKEWNHPILTCNASITSLFHNDEYLIIGDKDEKIRLVKNGKIHEVHRFCLNHAKFLTSLVLLNQERFCSSGADSKLVIWNVTTGEVEDELYCNSPKIETLFSIKKFRGKDTKEIGQKCIVHNMQYSEEHNAIFAIVENAQGIIIFPLQRKSPNELFFNGASIDFQHLPHEAICLRLVQINEKTKIAYIDKEKGNLHLLDITTPTSTLKVCTLKLSNSFEHHYFEPNGKKDIGLIDFWKHNSKQMD